MAGILTLRKTLTVGLLTASVVAASLAAAPSAQAVPMIGIQIFLDGALHPPTALVAGGPASLNDSSPFFNTISITSVGAPASPDPNFGTITISAAASFATGSHTLTLVSTQTGLTGSGFGSPAHTL